MIGFWDNYAAIYSALKCLLKYRIQRGRRTDDWIADGQSLHGWPTVF
jgi:hypothetical protein